MEAIVIIAVIVVALIVISALSGSPRRRYNDYSQDYYDPHDPYYHSQGRALHHPPHHYPEPYHRHEYDEYSRRYGHGDGMGALLVGMTLFALFFIFISAA